jgi:hypothetical protein
MSYYIIKNKYTIPGFLFSAIASWVIAVTGVTIFLIIVWIVDTTAHFDLLKASPWPLKSLLDLCGAYAGLGGICLYVTMWVYWIAVERCSILARIGWLIALLFGLHYGALIYALKVWTKDVSKVRGQQPLHGISVGG